MHNSTRIESKVSLVLTCKNSKLMVSAEMLHNTEMLLMGQGLTDNDDKGQPISPRKAAKMFKDLDESELYLRYLALLCCIVRLDFPKVLSLQGFTPACLQSSYFRVVIL